MEEFPTEYPQQTEYPGTDTGTGTTSPTESGTTPPNTSTGSTGSSGGLGGIFRPGISGGSGTGSLAGLFASGSSLLSRMLNMTDPKPKVAEKPETPTTAPAPLAPSANNAQIKPWMWYVGGAVLGLAIIGGILYVKNRNR